MIPQFCIFPELSTFPQAPCSQDAAPASEASGADFSAAIRNVVSEGDIISLEPHSKNDGAESGTEPTALKTKRTDLLMSECWMIDAQQTTLAPLPNHPKLSNPPTDCSESNLLEQDPGSQPSLSYNNLPGAKLNSVALETTILAPSMENTPVTRSNQNPLVGSEMIDETNEVTRGISSNTSELNNRSVLIDSSNTLRQIIVTGTKEHALQWEEKSQFSFSQASISKVSLSSELFLEKNHSISLKTTENTKEIRPVEILDIKQQPPIPVLEANELQPELESTGGMSSDVSDDSSKGKTGKSMQFRPGSATNFDATLSTSKPVEQHGIPPALKEFVMDNHTQMSQIADFAEKKLPISQSGDLNLQIQDSALPQSSKLLHNTIPEAVIQSIALSDISIPSPHSTNEAQTTAVPEIPPSASDIDELVESVINHASELRQTGANSLQVIIKSHQNTDVLLQLKAQGQTIEASVQCDPSIKEQLDSHWHLIQENLSKQGIEISPLHDWSPSLSGNVSSRLDNASSDTGSFDRQTSRQYQQASSEGHSFLRKPQSKPDTAQSLTGPSSSGAARRWEKWA